MNYIIVINSSEVEIMEVREPDVCACQCEVSNWKVLK